MFQKWYLFYKSPDELLPPSGYLTYFIDKVYQAQPITVLAESDSNFKTLTHNGLPLVFLGDL